MQYQIDKKIIEELLEGYWYVEPPEDWKLTHVSESRYTALGKQTLFIAMDEKTWQKGTENTGIYANWLNTHELVHEYQNLFGGVIAQYPIKSIDSKIPQFITPDPFQFINQFSQYIRERLDSKIIAITGTVGKTSTKDYLKQILTQFSSVYATNKNHNSRTGVKLTLINAMSNLECVILETAMSALWMKSGGISQLSRPHIAVITEIGVGQKGYDEFSTADMKSRIANGIEENGLIVINRDITVFDQLLEYCKRFSENIITYGFHSLADVRVSASNGVLNLVVKDQEYCFDIPQYLDRGTCLNLSASLTVAYSLGHDLSQCEHLFKNLVSKPSVLQPIEVIEKNITIIDDTYNAEKLSMINAFQFCKAHFEYRRKILVIGDIINLEDKSIEVHQSLAAPIMENDFSLVATFGQDTLYLNQQLPVDKVIGHFKNVDECVTALTAVCRKDDVILVKGSRRNSKIQNIPLLLKKELIEPSKKMKEILNEFSYRFEFSKDEDQKGLEYSIQYGVGSLMLLYLALKKFTLKEITLDHFYRVSENVAREGKSNQSFGLKYGDQYSFSQLVQYVVFTQKADAILALAECMFGNTAKALAQIKMEAKVVGVDDHEILNVTGRNYRQTVQSVRLRSLFILCKAISQFPKKTLNLLKNKTIHHQKTIQFPTLFSQFDDQFIHLFIGDPKRQTLICFNQNYLGLFHFKEGSATQEYILPKTMQFGHETQNFNKKIALKTPFINILADTYFGEFYTRIRQRKQVDDALQKHGYNFSFRNVEQFFKLNDLNMLNLECCFTESLISPLKLIKPFVLDAKAEHTLKEIKQRNFQLINLANNHAKDFGNEGLVYMLGQLKQQNIDYIGAGLNQLEAEQPIELSYKDQKVVIFNGYWHRIPAYLEFDFYALGKQSGVASLSGLLQVIQTYKKQFPDTKIIVIAHWGVDFKQVHPKQIEIAEQLVESGVDLILGHGAHTLQSISTIKQKPVIYSMGNGVFNSNGEFTKHQALPYGLISKINLKEKTLNLYPILTNNLNTFWQPSPVNQDEFKQVLAFFNQDLVSLSLVKGQDELGYFLSMEIFKE